MALTWTETDAPTRVNVNAELRLQMWRVGVEGRRKRIDRIDRHVREIGAARVARTEAEIKKWASEEKLIRVLRREREHLEWLVQATLEKA